MSDSTSTSIPLVPRWGRFEIRLDSQSPAAYPNPAQDVRVWLRLHGPSGRKHEIEAFWDGEGVWRARFSPGEIGEWSYTTHAEPPDAALGGREGAFRCGEPDGATAFDQHGPLTLSVNRRHLAHADGTPFLWVADTAWNGPLRATPHEWAHYLRERRRQGFTAVQWVATQWLAAPDGDLDGQKAYAAPDTPDGKIAINPAFFQRLDQYVEATARAGLLSIPVMLWAAHWSNHEVNLANPGYALAEDQAVVLARYMVARWAAYPVAWILPGDADYRSERQAERWRRIGRAVFNAPPNTPHAPVSLHPGGMQWNAEQFQDEAWLDIWGYQSGHGDGDETLAWLVDGPPATHWRSERDQSAPRPIINLEPPYENHITYQSKTRISADFARRALYWSMLVSPTAGVTYGGHGVWGWDDGTQPPVAHPNTGIPLPWQQALVMDAAEQVRHLADFFQAIAWWRLVPAPELVVAQPGAVEKGRFVAASRSEQGDLAVVYIPADREITLDLRTLAADLPATWFNPRTGARQTAAGDSGRFATPAPGDWVLLFGHPHAVPATQGAS
jgi:hypothetical protein